MFPSPERTHNSPAHSTSRIHLLQRHLPHDAAAILLEDIARRALLRTRASGAAIALEDNGVFICRASIGETAPAVGTRVDKNNGLSGLCLRTGSVLVCDDAENDARVEKEACQSLEIRSIVTVPVRSGCTGLLEVFSREPHAFDDEAVAFLSTLGQEIGPALKGERKASEPDLDIDEHSAPEMPVHVAENAESRKLVAYVLVASSLVFAGAAISAGLTVRDDLRMPAPPAAQVASVPDFPMPVISTDADTTNKADVTSARPIRAAVQHPKSGNANAEALRSGTPQYQYELARKFAEGRGVKQDLVQAYAWFVVAGMNGNRNSDAMIRSLTRRMPEFAIAQVRFRLGQMFENGQGVPQDFVTSYAWYELSEAAGDPRAAEQKRRLASVMSEPEVLEAARRAHAWLAERSRFQTTSRLRRQETHPR